MLTGDPLWYVNTQLEFTAQSSQVSLIGTAGEYSVIAELASYPKAAHETVTTAEATGTINFNDACDTP